MSREFRCQSCGASLNVREQGAEGIVRCDYCGTDCVVEVRGGSRKAEYNREFVSRLHRAIDNHFTEEETRDLVFELSGALPAASRIEYDDLAGRGQGAKARELVLWCQRRSLLQELVDVVYSVRPSIEM